MSKRIAYFAAAGIGVLAALILVVFNGDEYVTTPAALCILWAVIMLALGVRQRA